LKHRATGRRRPLNACAEDIMCEEVTDALAATQSERIDAMIALLDSAYELWTVRGFSRDEGLCRFPGITQQRRRGLCRDRRDCGSRSHSISDTRDLDVLIEPTIENAEKARRAVAAWGSFNPEYSPADFISGDILSFGGLLRVDIHSRVPGVDWNELWNGRLESELLGIPTNFAGIDELIRMKSATADAVKDLPDVQRLQALRKLRKND
jgi:hypothetical protein